MLTHLMTIFRFCTAIERVIEVCFTHIIQLARRSKPDYRSLSLKIV